MNEALTNSMMYYGFAIPGFFLLMGIEYLFDLKTGKKNYRLNDAITNISTGIGSSVSGIFIKALMVFFFTLAYKLAPFKIPSNIMTGILLLFLFDLSFYWAHRIGHEVNMFWAAHIVHHQSEEYNLSVALRQPWFLDIMTLFLFLPLPLMGFDPKLFVIISAADALYQFGIHTGYIGKLPRVVEFIFNTPSHHRVHHSVNKQYLDKNYGGMFIIWDRIFGTFEEEKESPVYGITRPFKSWNPVWANFYYWVELFKISQQSQKFSDKLKVFFQPPGWFPDEMGGYQPPVALKGSEQVKYDPKVSGLTKWYVGTQFLIILVVVTLFLNFQSRFAILEMLWPSIIILMSTISMGALLEQKAWKYVIEISRLFLLLFYIGYVDLILGEIQGEWLVLSMIYILFSLLSLYYVKYKDSQKSILS